MKKLIAIFIILIIYSIRIFANNGEVEFTASAPETVVVGEQFRLSYTATTTQVKNLQLPSIKGFEILIGPNRSIKVQSINGNTSETSTYTYILMAKEVGEYTIPGASVVADGKQMVSNSVNPLHLMKLYF